MFDSYRYKEARRKIGLLIDQGQNSMALVTVNAHLAHNSLDANALLLKGEVLRLLARYSEAEEVLVEAQLEFDFKSAWVVYQELGSLYKQWGRLEMALAAFEKTAVLFPERVAGHVMRGSILALLGRLEEAAESHGRGTLARVGDPSWAHHNLGLIRRAQERYEEARTCFWAALDIDPDYWQAAAALADIEGVLKPSRHLFLV